MSQHPQTACPHWEGSYGRTKRVRSGCLFRRCGRAQKFHCEMFMFISTASDTKCGYHLARIRRSTSPGAPCQFLELWMCFGAGAIDFRRLFIRVAGSFFVAGAMLLETSTTKWRKPTPSETCFFPLFNFHFWWCARILQDPQGGPFLTILWDSLGGPGTRSWSIDIALLLATKDTKANSFLLQLWTCLTWSVTVSVATVALHLTVWCGIWMYLGHLAPSPTLVSYPRRLLGSPPGWGIFCRIRTEASTFGRATQ